MRRIPFTLILAVALCGARPAAAQTGRFTASIGGGITFPTGSLSDSNKTGGHGTVRVGYRPLGSHHVWSGEASLHQLEQITNPDDSLGKVHSNIMMFMARYDHDLSSGLYLTGAVGMVRHEYKVRLSNVVLTNTDSHLGIAVGAGVTLAQRIFVEGRMVYSHSSPDATIFVPVTLGIRF